MDNQSISDIKKQIALCSEGEVQMLNRFLGFRAFSGFVNSSEDGGYIAQLSKKKLVEPFGKVEDKTRWRLTELVRTLECRQFIKELLNQEL